MDNCILCDSAAIINRQEGAGRTIYNCRYCGVFVISDLIENEVAEHSHEISAFLERRRLLNASQTVLISYDKANLDKDYLQLTVGQIVDLFPKTLTEQIEMSLKNLELLCGLADKSFRVNDLKPMPLFFLKSPNLDALSSIIKSMQDAGFIDVVCHGSSFFPCDVTINTKGRERLVKLGESSAERKNLFACISNRDRKLGRQFLGAISKASRETGLYLSNISSGDTKIGNLLNSSIKLSSTVICDLTDPTPEVYYTVGSAKALGKSCILTCHKEALKNLALNSFEFEVLAWERQEQLYLEIVNKLKAGQ